MMQKVAKIGRNKELDQAKQELKILEDDVANAYYFLQKNRKGYFRGKKKIPLYLLFGPARFGKTTLLAQAGLNLKNSNEQALTHVVPTKYCSFWFSQDALYVDTAGDYTKPEITKPRTDLIWQGFIKLLQKYFGKNAIAGCLIVLDLPAIAQDNTLLKKTLFCVRERVYELANLVRTLPLYIVFTKCDRLAGFAEFFAALDRNERMQPLGIEFSTRLAKVDPVPTFSIRFDEFLYKLNQRVIELLQKTLHQEQRVAIRSFPAQIDNLRQLFIEVLGKIPSSQQILLSGIYFTSSIQEGAPIDNIWPQMVHAFNLQPQPPVSAAEISDNKCYFIEDLFKKVITTPATAVSRRKFKFQLQFRTSFIYAFLLILAMVSTSSWIAYRSYYRNLSNIGALATFLQTQLVVVDLDNLQAMVQQLNDANKSWWLKLGINETKTLAKALTKSYKVSFLQTLTLQVQSHLAILTTAPSSQANSQQLYQALKIYLMLNDPSKINRAYFRDWFSNYWQRVYSNESAKRVKMLQQLDILLVQPFKTELNPQLVALARERLHNLPPSQLAYLILLIKATEQHPSTSDRSINDIYTKQQFTNIYNKQIPDVVNNFPSSDWVLGDNLKLPGVPAEIIKACQQLYIDDYVTAWEKIVALGPNLELQDLPAAAKQLSDIASNNAPLMQLLQQLAINTNIPEAPPEFVKAVNTKLQGLSDVNLANLQSNLANMAQFLDAIAHNANPNKAAFDAVITHLQNDKPDTLTTLKLFTAEQTTMLRSWLQPIFHDSWKLLLDASYTYINSIWSNEVYPKYLQQLANKYPLNKGAKDDIRIEDFNDFFKPHSTLDNFFTQYINPFVNIEKTNWSLKELDAQKMNFAPNTLDMFLRAALIQKMFYLNEESTPTVKMRFVPIDMTPITKEFKLNIDGQVIIYTQSDRKSYQAAWPGPKPGVVTAAFTDFQDKNYTTSQFGPWAWFRIIDKANLAATSNPHKFELTFDLNGNAMKYELAITSAINPFTSQILNGFHCLPKL